LALVDKAIWYIESHYGHKVSLDDLARVAGVSRYHLSRAFSYATGVPITRYLRQRRLSQAAKALAAGNGDILDLALSLGYGSHEAFSRAFKDTFGVTPESVRRRGDTGNLKLTEAIRMNETKLADAREPRIERLSTLLVAGIARKYRGAENAAIPGQWQEFGPLIGTVPGRKGDDAYGVVYNMDDESNHQYLCGVEVADFGALPDHLARLRIAEQTYAVFDHPDHVSEIRRTCHTAFADWLPQSGYQAVDAPFFERYGASFDPETGLGGLEVWIPVE
jgi:AraC family transcriptional regulator